MKHSRKSSVEAADEAYRMYQEQATERSSGIMDFHNYDPENGPFFDEVFLAPDKPRQGFERLVEGINTLAPGVLQTRQQAAEHTLLKMGITFTLRGESGDSSERIFPFDVIPRVIGAQEWTVLERGIKQRLTALNHFLTDVYGARRIIKEGVIPQSLIDTCVDFRPQCVGLKPPQGSWCHISGTDLVRHNDGNFYVLEDNVRCPSGVSYVLENRNIVKRIFPKLFNAMSIRPVDDYPVRLLEMLRYLGQNMSVDPRVVVLTPGRYNSAYYEHCFLAQQMGVELVESQDLVVRDGYVQMRTTRGFERVDVIYRRVGDDYLDPEVFRPDSLLGIPGVMRAYLDGKVALANAPGTGVADDKAVYAYVEKMIRFYLGEDAILRNVPTYVCWDPKECQYVLEHLAELVVKATDGAGGYGMLVGPHSTVQERKEFAERVKANPRGYIAQPTLSLSRVPTIIGDKFEPRHVDLRPYALFGKDIYVQPGGLTRVALRRGSLVVNSSQGGGSKDTWVLAD
ncbi:MAG TPA: circularly permuted type 2 ATP-grasp protein [Polyangiaceae bacterium]|nr:circularly permuted type 2 ATP-grasp protein [Polyangiaceae bacterium]